MGASFGPKRLHGSICAIMYKILFNCKAIFVVRVLIILACNSPLASLNSGEASISNRECNDT